MNPILCLLATAALSLAIAAAIACGSGEGAAPSSVGGTKAAGRLSGDLAVFAAASLTESFRDIVERLEEASPGLDIALSLAGSQQLRAQIEQGAPADVFASASPRHMRVLEEAGLLAGEPAVFARNRLVVVVPKGNPAGVEALPDLARPGLKLDIGNENIPVGEYTRRFLDKASASGAFGSDYRARVLANVVSEEESVKQIVAKVALGEADAGVVFVSDVTPKAAPDLLAIDIPDEYNVTATYLIAVLEGAGDPALAQAFVDYVLSAEGQAILGEHGFIPVVP